MQLLLEPKLKVTFPGMRRCSFFHYAAAALLLGAGSAWGQSSRDTTRPTTSASAQAQKSDAARRGARGQLPDPVLLDGSNQQPEKKPDYGMLGEFEMPGDENVKQSDRVGGQQNQTPAGMPSGGAQSADSSQSQGGGAPSGTPPAAGGSPGGGAQPPPGQPANQGAMAGGSGPAQNDPNAKAEGVQVAGLSGDAPDSAAAGGAGGANDVPKPQQVALGDPTMRIKPAVNAPGTVGAVTAGSTQQMESKISNVGGGGSKEGKNSSEKGRVMPAGL